MRYSITAPNHIDTTILLPASKSISNRALIIHALANGNEMPQNLSDCDDTEVIIRALKDNPYEIDIKAGGTAMRFMTAYLAVTPSGEHELTGTERMQHRPIGPLVDALRRLGAKIEYKKAEGYPPLLIEGRQLDGGVVEMEGNISSQYISAMLMAGPVMRHGMELHLTGDIISRPYIDLTLCTMRDFGAEVEWTGPNTIQVQPRSYRQTPYFIENDWSAASYWYEILSLCDDDSSVRLDGLTDGSRQGDSVARYLFSMLGVKTTFGVTEKGVPTTVKLNRHHTVIPRIVFDFVNQPDLAQTFVVTCALLNIPFHFKGLHTLRIKETDRIEALKTEMRKLGFVVESNESNDLIWNGERCDPMPHPVIMTYEDHRMALAFAPAAIKFPGLRIDTPTVVTKSYPRYWEDLKKAGFKIEEEP
jgi:3-phosphoshikimate 1-carboxyvinyltransferase